MGSLRKRGNIWHLRYSDCNGVRVEVSAKTSDRAEPLRILEMRERVTKGPGYCQHCGEMPTQARAYSLHWLRRVEQRYGGRLPSTNVLQMLVEQEIWSRLKKRVPQPSADHVRKIDTDSDGLDAERVM